MKQIIYNKSNNDTLTNEENLIITNKNNAKNVNIADKKAIILSKIRNFSKNNIDYIISAITVFVIFMFALIINQNQPFGKNSVLFSDSHAQIASFFNHIFNVFEGKSSLFYSNYFGKGMNIFSTLEYMYFNPFYLIVLFCGRSNIIVSFTFSILFMLIFNSIIFIWFTRKHFKNINILCRILLSICYVFSTYLNFNIAFISWILYPALILILIDSFIHFLKTDKNTKLIITYVWYIISCFSVGISTSIILFLITTLYFFLCFEKQERNKKLTGLFVVFITTALICLIILLPAIIDILFTNRTNSTSILENILGVSLFSPINKLGTILFNSAILLFSIFYFIKCNKKEKFNKFLLITFAILFLPTLFDSIMKIICFSSFEGFSARFYFLNESFLFLISMILFDKNMLNIKDSITKKSNKILYFTLLSAVFLALIVIIAYYINDVSLFTKSPIYTKNIITLTFLLIFLILGILLFVTLLSNYKNKIGKRITNITIFFILCSSIVTNILTFSLNLKANYNTYDEIYEITNSLDIQGNFKITNCSDSSKFYNFNSTNLRNTSVFSSLISSKNLEANSILGYYTSDVLTLNSTGTLLSDSLMGIKYYVSSKEMNRPYLTQINKSNNFYLYENVLCSNGSFILDSSISFNECKDFIEIFNNLKNYFNIEGELFSQINLPVIECTDNNGNKFSTCRYTAKTDGILYLRAFLEFESPLENGYETFYVNAYNLTNTQDIAFIKSEETFNFNLKNYNESTIDALFLNYDIAESICKKIVKESTDFKYTKNGYTVLAEIEQNETLYIMMPNINGMNYFINNSNTEIDEILGGMISVKNNNGNVFFEAKFNYPNDKIWIISSVIFIILIVSILLLYHYTKFKHINNIIGLAMMSVSILIILIVYCFGILLAICDVSFQIIQFFG